MPRTFVASCSRNSSFPVYFEYREEWAQTQIFSFALFRAFLFQAPWWVPYRSSWHGSVAALDLVSRSAWLHGCTGWMPTPAVKPVFQKSALERRYSNHQSFEVPSEILLSSRFFSSRIDGYKNINIIPLLKCWKQLKRTLRSGKNKEKAASSKREFDTWVNRIYKKSFI